MNQINKNIFIVLILSRWQIEELSSYYCRPTQPGRIQDFSNGGGVHLRSTTVQAKETGGGVREGGPILGPMLKSLHSGPERGGPDPLPPDPPMLLIVIVILIV